MSDDKKYYYLKLKDNFFDTDEIVVLESMPDGHLYSNILMKLYLRSLKYEGKLMFKDRIPYNPDILASVTRHSVGVVKEALTIFEQLGLIEIMDNGAIYMLDIQNFIGKSSTEADRKREYRHKIDSEKLLIGQTSGQMSDISPPEIELEKEKEIDKEIKKEYTIKFNPLDEPYTLTQLLIDKIVFNNEYAKVPDTDKKIDSWCVHIDRMIRIDKIDPSAIESVINWCQSDSFWQNNILSTKKLRDKFATLHGQSKKYSAVKSNNDFADSMKEMASW